MRKFMFTTIFILMSFLTFAEKKTFIVVDKDTEEELIAAKIIVNNTTYYTDFDGLVVIDVEDSSSLKVTYPSYETKIIDSKSQIVKLESK